MCLQSCVRRNNVNFDDDDCCKCTSVVLWWRRCLQLQWRWTISVWFSSLFSWELSSCSLFRQFSFFLFWWLTSSSLRINEQLHNWVVSLLVFCLESARTESHWSVRVSCCKDTCNDIHAESSFIFCHCTSAVHRFYAYDEWQSAKLNTDKIQAWMCTSLLQAFSHQHKRCLWSVSKSQHTWTDCVKALWTWTKISWFQQAI